jgi:YesN/AraC family two-component response regulator
MSLFNTVRLTREEKESIQMAIKYLEDNYQGKITADELSQHFSIPLKRFQKGFKQATGSTVHDFLLAIRIQKAKNLLHTDEPIKNIPEKSGFSNPTYFWTVFKKLTGETPIEYRIRHSE